MDSISVFTDVESLSEKAAGLFVEHASRAISVRGVFNVAFSGGSTPRLFFSALASKHKNEIKWNKIGVFFTDERCVPPEHEESNFRLANETLLEYVPIPDENIHRIKGELKPVEAASEYETVLRNSCGGGMPAFDLIMLGLGADGHTASLFPETEVLMEKDHLARAVYVPHLNKWRVTLTLPVINNAEAVIFLVSGAAKAKVAAEILNGVKDRERYPAGLIYPKHGIITWLLDSESAGVLLRYSR